MSELRRQMKMRREREKNRKREEENVGSLASFGSRCVTSPCHANAWPRLRFGSLDPGCKPQA